MHRLLQARPGVSNPAPGELLSYRFQLQPQSNTPEPANQGLQGYLLISDRCIWSGLLEDGSYPGAGLEIPGLDNGTLTLHLWTHCQTLRWCGGSWVPPGPHVVRVCRQFLEDEGIDTIEWPARSPELSLIEHLWDIMFWSSLQLRLSRSSVMPRSRYSRTPSFVSLRACPDVIRQHTNTWEPHKLLCTILRGFNDISAKWTSLLHHFFT